MFGISALGLPGGEALNMQVTANRMAAIPGEFELAAQFALYKGKPTDSALLALSVLFGQKVRCAIRHFP